MTGRARYGANLATLANGAVGVGAILYILAGNKLWAMLLIVCGIGFDGLDGWLSRRAGAPTSAFGRYADSIADAVTFGLAPGTLLLVHSDRPVLWAPFASASLLVGVAVAGLAIARLVYFTARGYQRDSFLGAPTPQAALAIIVLVLVADVPAFVGTNPPLVLVGSLLVALTMVVPLPFPKIRRSSPLRPAMILTGIALVLALLPLQFAPSEGSILYRIGFGGTVASAVGILAYYLIGPFTVRAPPPSTAPPEAS
ncbi:MAG: CDP-alcohol phosphatidyltransferase family protein [Thermoplasmata archaeon]|nr:CDP-alcohol phosphatidyltransferase family protein [Thermoplasmata archaeon]